MMKRLVAAGGRPSLSEVQSVLHWQDVASVHFEGFPVCVEEDGEVKNDHSISSIDTDSRPVISEER